MLKNTYDILGLMMSGWLVLLACMSGAPYVKAPLDGGYTAQLTEELGIYWMDLEPLCRSHVQLFSEL